MGPTPGAPHLHLGQEPSLVGKDVAQPRVLRREGDAVPGRTQLPGKDQHGHGATRLDADHAVVLADTGEASYGEDMDMAGRAGDISNMDGLLLSTSSL